MGEDEAVTEADTEAGPNDPPAPAPPPDRSTDTLIRYQARMRRARILYFSIVGVVVAALIAGVAVAWSRGEAAHASLHMFASPPSSLPVQSPSPTLQPAWRTSDHLAIGTPQSGGTVITYSTHTVGGRDARTGRPTWTYTRTDRTVCTAAQANKTTIAVYRLHGNCDEVSAFDSETGRRRWTRTLDKDGKPIDGTPHFQVLPYTFMVSSDTVVYAIDPVSGFDRWTYYRYGCRITGAVLGSAGALIAQNCAPYAKCKGLKFCAHGPQLLLRDGSAGNGDDSDPNRDKIKWLRRDDHSAPVSADTVISAVRPDGTTLDLLAEKNGTPQQQVTVGAGAAPDTLAVAVGAAELVFRSGKIYAVRSGTAVPAWTIDAAGPATVATASSTQVVTLAGARITVPLADGVGVVDGNDGRLSHRFAVPAPRPAAVYALGTGFLIGGSSGVTAYR
jgi:outer membrane protein assembly factor BamB